MLRSKWSLAGFAVLSLGFACSDDGSGGGEESAGDAGSGGSAGSSMSGEAGSLSSSGAGGSSASEDEGPTYSVDEVCQRFAEVTCTKGLECGLVLQRVGANVVCIQCSPLALTIIENGCRAELSGPKNAADVDACLAALSADSCSNVCGGVSVPGCESFDELPGDSGPLDCTAECIE